MPLLNTSGKRIRVLRVAAGLNQAQLAERIGIAQNTLSVIETDQRKVSVDQALELARALNTTAAYLLCLTNTLDPEVACVPA